MNLDNEALKERLHHYAELLVHFNQRINLISKNTTREVWKRHIEHCLNLTYKSFPNGVRVVDWGTGGGLPAIPLALCFPQVEFVAIDAVGKKIQAVRAIARKLALDNLAAWHGRAESWTGELDYSVSRATAPLSTLWTWHERVARPAKVVEAQCWLPGLICLKGGDLSQEVDEMKTQFPGLTVTQTSIEETASADISAAKYIVEVRS